MGVETMETISVVFLLACIALVVLVPGCVWKALLWIGAILFFGWIAWIAGLLLLIELAS